MSEALYQMYNLQMRLDIKHTVDGGKAQVNDAVTDPNGTVVFFTKPFRDVDSITVTAEGPVSLNAIYIFDDVPNPTSFKAMLFTTSGVRTSGVISWKARGKL
jgi:hypothetical protein